MKNYSGELYNIQKQYAKQVNLLLKDNLQTDFKEFHAMLKAKGHTSENKYLSIADGKELVWSGTKNKYRKQIFIKTQSRLFIVEMDDYESDPRLENSIDNRFSIRCVPYEEDGIITLKGKKSLLIYRWEIREPKEFDLMVINRIEIISYYKYIDSFLINWESLHCELTNG